MSKETIAALRDFAAERTDVEIRDADFPVWLDARTQEYRAWLARETCPHTRIIIRDELRALRTMKNELRTASR